MKKRVLVTGGAGFIGTHLCRRLIAEDCEVICLDDLSSGFEANIKDLKGEAGFTFLNRDVRDPVDVDVDRIYHLACPASPIYYQKDPVRTLTTSVMGALSVLDLAVKCGARVLYTSTSEIYGEPLVHPQPESYRGNVNPIGPRACYDEGKRAAETLFFDYHRTRGADIRVARLFNCYGPGMHPSDGRVVSNFVRQALAGEPLTIYGDGSQTRSFCYVSDTVEGLIRLMEAPGLTGPCNIGNPGEFTVRELAEKVIALTGSGSEIVTRPLPADDPTRRQPDITFAKEHLGWEPTVPLEEGLKLIIEEFKNRSDQF